MKNVFGAAVLCVAAATLAACGAPGQERAECDAAQLEQAALLLSTDPVESAQMLEQQPDCDAKFSLLYQADRQIARRSDDSFFYDGQVNPRGWNGTPNRFEAYVIAHREQFISASEGRPLGVSDYCIKQIRDRRHEAIGEFEWLDIREFDEFVWEDGDGSARTREIVSRYRAWLETWPGHPRATAVRKRIDELQRY